MGRERAIKLRRMKWPTGATLALGGLVLASCVSSTDPPHSPVLER